MTTYSKRRGKFATRTRPNPCMMSIENEPAFEARDAQGETSMTRTMTWTTSRALLAAAACLVIAGSAAAKSEPVKFGQGGAYEALARLVAQHEGRAKPFDTLAREEVKSIFGRETIKFMDEKGDVASTWGPVAAVLDWSVRPEFWDEQPFILTPSIALRRAILADAIEARLTAVADKPTTSAADRDALRALVKKADLSSADLKAFLASAKIADEDAKQIGVYVEALGEAHQWLTPRDLESARIESEGQKIPFRTWLGMISDKSNAFENNPVQSPRPTEVERRGLEVGTRLLHYQALRDREFRGESRDPTFTILPRPSNEAYLKYTAKAFQHGQKVFDEQGQKGIGELSPLEIDAVMAYTRFLSDHGIKKELPGTDAKFDETFTTWLRGNSRYVPLGVLLASKPEELVAAGYPQAEIVAFRDAFAALEQGENAEPGRVDPALAERFVAAARAVGESLSGGYYLKPAQVSREVLFNKYNPFFLAPYGYGLGMALLLASLGIASKTGVGGVLGRLTHVAGVVGLALGIGLEFVGFVLRIWISGWAPVTNMYETVIWVSFVAATLGLIFELIFRQKFTALAASGVALLGTLLASQVPLLDPSIRALNPVLRSNFWLATHVLTEVSSYAAFALAMMLGLIATVYYLGATYKRTPRWGELATPFLYGLPLFAAGMLGLNASYGAFGPAWVGGDAAFYVSAAIFSIGMLITGGTAVALLGETFNRATFAPSPEPRVALEAPSPYAPETSSTGVEDARRAAAMQAAALNIKPLANFIYRTMQVGVLLITAGTFLGCVWADYSWGRFWGWDPKEVWALATLIVYLVPLHGRFAGWINTFNLVIASVVCFLSVIMAWYGVNFLLGVGLHSYGFVEGGSQGVVGVVILAVLTLPAGAIWRRALARSSKPVAPVAKLVEREELLTASHA